MERGQLQAHASARLAPTAGMDHGLWWTVGTIGEQVGVGSGDQQQIDRAQIHQVALLRRIAGGAFGTATSASGASS